MDTILVSKDLQFCLTQAPQVIVTGQQGCPKIRVGSELAFWKVWKKGGKPLFYVVFFPKLISVILEKDKQKRTEEYVLLQW